MSDTDDSREKCRAGIRTVVEGWKRANFTALTESTLVLKDKDEKPLVILRLLCLSDTVDPRGPKTK